MPLFNKKRSTIIFSTPRGTHEADLFEGLASATIMPGDLILPDGSGNVVPLPTADYTGILYVAIEDRYQTDEDRRSGIESADLPYNAGDTVTYTRLMQGFRIQSRATVAVAINDGISTDAAGKTKTGGTLRGVTVTAQPTIGDRYIWEVA
ncbi:MAG: hypothetical protein ACPG8W_22030 [Candidatus Promineifilaceae bacterium]